MIKIKVLKFILPIIALVGYLGLVVFGPIHIVHMSSTNMPMQDCPFDFGQYYMCQMNNLEHLGVWKSMTSAVLPIIAVLLGAFVLLSVLLRKNFILTDSLILYSKQKSYEIITTYQNLFSKGLIHPKIP